MKPVRFSSGIKGVMAEIEKSGWSSELILRLKLDGESGPKNASAMICAAAAFRKKFGKEFDDAFVSHWSYDAYPSYPSRNRAIVPPVGNVAVAVPAFSSGNFDTLCDRFSLGVKAVKWLDKKPFCDTCAAQVMKPVILPEAAGTIEPEVFVAGLGTGGSFAALAAARAGSDVLAVEPQTFPGGVATAAGISSYYFGCPGGMQDEVDDDIEEIQTYLGSKGHMAPGFSALSKQAVLEADLAEECVAQFYDSFVIAVNREDDRIIEVMIAAPAGVFNVRAKAFVDATGEGTLCNLASVPSRKGRAGDGCLHAFTQSWGTFGYFPHGLQAFIHNPDSGFVDPEDSVDMTNARVNGIRMLVNSSSVRSSNSFNRTTGIFPSLGIRQGRLIETEVRLSLDDLVERRRFRDSIGYTGGHCDIHSQDFFVESDKLAFYNWCSRTWAFPTCCEIPYRAILPKGLSNVWLACRAAGCDEDASNGMRMQRDMQRLGEVAGFAAAISVHDSCTNAEVSYEILCELLRKTGAMAPLDGKSERFGRAANVFDGDPVLTGSCTDEKIKIWLNALDGAEPGIALWRLYRVGSEALSERIRPLLKSDSADAVWNAALLLGAWGDRAAVPRLLAAIAERETFDKPVVPRSVPRCRAAAWALGKCSDMRSVPLLADLASCECSRHGVADNITRLTALWSLGTIARSVKLDKTEIAAISTLLDVGVNDISDSLRPWERPFVCERLRKFAGIQPSPHDAELIAADPCLLARRAYDNILKD